MVFLQYGILDRENYYLVREHENNMEWPYRDRKTSTSKKSLEDEIHRLREQMEQAFAENNSLTSETVMEISKKLDAKINEYNEYIRTHEKS